MPSYKVIKSCYVPFGNKQRFRAAGKTITLEVDEAAKLDGYVRLIGDQETVQKLDTEATVEVPDSEPIVHFLDSSATIEQEVTEDAGEPGTVDE